MIKVFGFPSHSFVDRTSGVDFLRIIQPLEHLKKTEGFKVTLFDPRKKKSFDWRDVFNEHDIVYFNYTTNDIGYAIMGLMAQKYKRKLVCDLDDNIFDILPDNSAYGVFKKGSAGRNVVKAILGDVSYVTCTNRHLRNAIVFNTTKNHEKVKVFPNYIDLDLYNYRCEFKDTPTITIGHFGSSTHFDSLVHKEFYKGMERIMYDYPNVNFLTIGSFFPHYRMKWGQRYAQGMGDTDIYKWIKKMPEFMDKVDMIVAPLTDNVYNRSKSACKRWEASSYKKPFIGQRIRQYEEVITDGKDGFLCTSADEWYKAIKLLCDDRQLRRKIGEEGYERTVKEARIQDHIGDYTAFFKEIVDNC